MREKLQRLNTLQGWREVIATGHRFSEAQHRVAFAVGIAEHAQQLLLDVIQARAVGAEIETMGAAGGAVRQALTDDFQPFAIFFLSPRGSGAT